MEWVLSLETLFGLALGLFLDFSWRMGRKLWRWVRENKRKNILLAASYYLPKIIRHFAMVRTGNASEVCAIVKTAVNQECIEEGSTFNEEEFYAQYNLFVETHGNKYLHKGIKEKAVDNGEEIKNTQGPDVHAQVNSNW